MEEVIDPSYFDICNDINANLGVFCRRVGIFDRKERKVKVLQLTAHFSPNIGGVETHLNDLVKALINRGWEVFVLTYRPLTTDAKWKMYEKDKGVEIFRIPWLPNLFYNLIKYPVLEFLYLLPGLFFVAPLVILVKNPSVIHVHGLVAGLVGVFWGRIFGKKVIISTHSIYHFPPQGLYRNFVKWIFKTADIVMGLSNQAVSEIKSLAPGADIRKFTYWIDLNKFKVQPIRQAQGERSKFKVKKQLGWDDKFTVLFVGRVVEEKGVNELLESVKTWNENINLKIIGSGPLEEEVRKAASKYKNVEFIGIIDQNKLPLYYSGSDILIVPSVSDEGFGRVILEALACGTPIIGANRGAIPEAMDKTVGKFIDVTPNNIKISVEYFYSNRGELKKLSLVCRNFAERRYSEKNVEKIIKAYTG